MPSSVPRPLVVTRPPLPLLTLETGRGPGHSDAARGRFDRHRVVIRPDGAPHEPK
jgi:hypothetical protein